MWVLSWGLLRASWIQLSWSSLIKVVRAHYRTLREHKQRCVSSAPEPSSAVPYMQDSTPALPEA